jgi:hypothetical protein
MGEGALLLQILCMQNLQFYFQTSISQLSYMHSVSVHSPGLHCMVLHGRGMHSVGILCVGMHSVNVHVTGLQSVGPKGVDMHGLGK